MTGSGVKLTVHFGELDRVEGHLLSDMLLDLFHRHGLRAAILLRGVEGFGIKQQLRTQRLLTLSEDLPLVAICLDTPERIGAVLPEVQRLVSGGLVTLERALLADGVDRRWAPEHLHEATKLTLYLGRQERSRGGGLAYRRAVDLLRAHGVAGATVVLGVDGVEQGKRRRARFFSRNEAVPLLVLSIGGAEAIAGALTELGAELGDPLATIERVQLCKREGAILSEPEAVAEEDAQGLWRWQKLMVYASEQARHGRHSLYVELVHRLRLAGAAGATAVRGLWGYSGDRAPHGDRLLALRRRVPVVVSLVDRPDAMRRWWPIVDELTAEAGLVTSEIVPAFRAVGPGISSGGLRLADLHPDPGA